MFVYFFWFSEYIFVLFCFSLILREVFWFSESLRWVWFLWAWKCPVPAAGQFMIGGLPWMWIRPLHLPSVAIWGFLWEASNERELPRPKPRRKPHQKRRLPRLTRATRRPRSKRCKWRKRRYRSTSQTLWRTTSGTTWAASWSFSKWRRQSIWMIPNSRRTFCSMQFMIDVNWRCLNVKEWSGPNCYPEFLLTSKWCALFQLQYVAFSNLYTTINFIVNSFEFRMGTSRTLIL